MKIPAKFDSKCYVCGVKIAAGTMIDYNKAGERGRKTRCLPCADRPADAAAPYVRIGNELRIDCDSVEQAIEYSGMEHEKNAGFAAACDSMTRHESISWYGIENATPSALRGIIANGWPAAADAMAQVDVGDIAPPLSVRRTRTLADSGDEVDVTAYWRGRGDVAWARCRRQQRRARRNVTIAANVSALGDVSADDLFWRGVAVMRLSDVLTAAGYNVEVIAVRKATIDGKTLHQRVLLKASTAPLDIAALSGTVAFPGFYRYTLFKLSAAAPVRVTKGKGSMETHTIDYTPVPGELAGLEAVTDAATAVQWIVDKIRELENESQTA